MNSLWPVINDGIFLLNGLPLIAQTDTACDLQRNHFSFSHPFSYHHPFHSFGAHLLILLSLIYESWTTVVSATPVTALHRYAFLFFLFFDLTTNQAALKSSCFPSPVQLPFFTSFRSVYPPRSERTVCGWRAFKTMNCFLSHSMLRAHIQLCFLKHDTLHLLNMVIS